jgi:hypothetical protein
MAPKRNVPVADRMTGSAVRDHIFGGVGAPRALTRFRDLTRPEAFIIVGGVGAIGLF